MQNVINLGLHTWHDFVDTAAKRLREPQISGYGASTAVHRGYEWDLGIDLAKAVKMAKEGWPEGVKNISAQLDKLPPESEVLPEWEMSVAGAICNVPAFIAGEPECMFALNDCRRHARRIALALDGVFAAAVNATAVRNYATAVAATARYLEASGIDVALYNVNTADIVAPTIYGIIIKDLGEPLDVAKVAFGFHPAFFRRIGFAWREITPAACSAKICGQSGARYGHSLKLTNELLQPLIQADTPIVPLRGFYDNIPQRGSVKQYVEVIKQDIAGAIAAM